MKFLTSAYRLIKKVSGVIIGTANRSGEVISGLVERAGAGLYDTLDLTGMKANIGPVFNWLGSVLKGVADITGSVVKGIFNVAGGLVGGVISFAGGILMLKPRLVIRGLAAILSPIVGMMIVVSGKILSTIQSLFLLQAFERRLSAEEIHQLKKVFRSSLDYGRIRIIEGRSGIFGLNARAFTLAHTIYLKKSRPVIHLMVHECTHVWQYRHLGITYSSDALGAQLFIKDAYDWELEINSRGKKEWNEFNMESQAEFLQDLWRTGQRTVSGGSSQRGNGAFFDIDWEFESGVFIQSGENYSQLARQATLAVWSG